MYDYIFKYIIIGNSGCGKSSITSSFCNSSYSLDHNVTIGVDFMMKIIDICNKKIKIQIWDTAGQEMFRSITKSYYKNTCVAIVVYDITNRDTFNNLPNWIQDIQDSCTQEPLIIVIGNKSDLHNKRKVSTEEGKTFCETHKYEFYETSVKKEYSIENIFIKSSTDIYKKICNNTIQPIKEFGITEISLQNTNHNISLEKNKSVKCFPCFI